MEVHQPSEQQLQCPTCLLPFPSTQSYKAHYKSDYHRYNLKRKMVKLAPVNQEQFSSKMQELKEQQNNQFACNQCRKSFASANTFNQHVQSKGHNPNAIIQPKPKVEKAPVVFEKNFKKCFFCCQKHDSLEQNLEHMQNQHSFFIAQKEYCTDLKGIIEYLQEKIEVGNMCLTCENKKTKDFQSGDAVRHHMIDRGHTFMKTQSGFEEYEKFYDFSALFEEKLKEQNNVVPGIEFEKVKVYVDEKKEKIKDENEDQDEEWEDEDEEEQGEQQQWQDEDEDEQQTGEVIKQESKKPKIKTYHIMKPTITGNDELLLPNGKILGHRKYKHIYKQTIRLPNYFAQQLKMITNGQNINTIAQRRQLLEAIKAERQNAQHNTRERKKWVHVGMNNNMLIRQHFRCQNSL